MPGCFDPRLLLKKKQYRISFFFFQANNHEVTLIQNELNSLAHVADIIGVEPVRKRIQLDKEKALRVSQNLMLNINAVSSTLVAR